MLKFGIKQKATVHMLLLISTLLLTLYFSNQSSNKNFLEQTAKNYKKSFNNYFSFFEKQLIKSYELQTIYLQNNLDNIDSLLKKNKFLKDIKIVNFKDEKTSTIYTKELLKGKSFIDIEVLQKDIFYKVIVPIIKNKELSSYVIYKIDSRVFLQGVKEFDGSDGIIFVIDNNKSNDIFLKKSENSKFFKDIAHVCENEREKPVVEFNKNIYVKNITTFKNFKNKDVANAIFFLDISRDKKAFLLAKEESILTSIFLFVIASIVVNYFFSYLIKRLEKKEEELKKINKNLEKTIENEIEHKLQIQEKALIEKQKNEQLLIQQSKLALLGEMIGNIAHQWRQPLMQLSAILMYLDAYNEKGKLSQEKFMKKVKEGNSIIDFMSKTIEDFRNYYKPEKQKEKFFLNDSINNALFIINSALKSSSIEVITKHKSGNIKLKSFKNEFSQSLLNIITNAKDILVLKEIKNAQIIIETFEDEKSINISVEDNAGGIQKENLEKIFDPYFTTKHKSQGTGIGLYMTKMIIENSMNGKIYVKNTKKGAKFTIKLKKS